MTSKYTEAILSLERASEWETKSTSSTFLGTLRGESPGRTHISRYAYCNEKWSQKCKKTIVDPNDAGINDVHPNFGRTLRWRCFHYVLSCRLMTRHHHKSLKESTWCERALQRSSERMRTISVSALTFEHLLWNPQHVESPEQKNVGNPRHVVECELVPVVSLRRPFWNIWRSKILQMAQTTQRTESIFVCMWKSLHVISYARDERVLIGFLIWIWTMSIERVTIGRCTNQKPGLNVQDSTTIKIGTV